MKYLITIAAALVLFSSCKKSPEESVKELTITQLNEKFKPVQLEGLEVKVYTDVPKKVYSKLTDFESKRWERRAKTYKELIGVSGGEDLKAKLNHEMDSITNILNKYFDEAGKTNESDIYYWSTAIVVKGDTTINKVYCFDNNLKLIGDTGNK